MDSNLNFKSNEINNLDNIYNEEGYDQEELNQDFNDNCFNNRGNIQQNEGSQIESNSSNLNEMEPIYVMSLELGDKIAKIKIYPDSEPMELAKNFCIKNNLDMDAVDYLKQQIEQLIIDYNNNDEDEENETNVDYNG